MPSRLPVARLLVLNTVILIVATVAVPLSPAPRPSEPAAEGPSDALAQIVRSAHPEDAIRALDERGDARSMDLLEGLCDARDPLLRGVALRALAGLAPERAAPRVLRRLEGELDPAERILVLEAALRSPAGALVPALEHHARSEDRLVRSLALGGLAAAGRKDAEVALAALADGSDPWEDLALAGVLLRAGCRQGGALRERALLSLPRTERDRAALLTASR